MSTVVWELRRPDETLLAWFESRPAYCDRGRWHANTETVSWKSQADPWPRYYFDIDRGKAEVEAYLDAKKIDRTGATWRCDALDGAFSASKDGPPTLGWQPPPAARIHVALEGRRDLEWSLEPDETKF